MTPEEAGQLAKVITVAVDMQTKKLWWLCVLISLFVVIQALTIGALSSAVNDLGQRVSNVEKRR